MAYTLTPVPFIGITPSGGMRIYTYESGTTTPATAYADAAGATPFGAYIEADSDGLFPAIYLPLQAFKFSFFLDGIVPPSPAFATADPVNSVPSEDDLGDVTGVAGEDIDATEGAYLSDGSGGKAAGGWYRWDATNTYSSIYPLLAYPTADVASGATGTFRQTGRQTGLTGLTPGSTYFVSLSTIGGLAATAPANARAVGVSDTSTSLVLFPQQRWGSLAIPFTQTDTSTGTVDNFTLMGGHPSTFIRANNATLLTLTGFTGVAPGRKIEIVSVGAGNVVLANTTGSTAENQIYTGLGADLTLFAGVGRAILTHDGVTNRWRVMSYTSGNANLISEGVQFPAVQAPSSGVNVLDDYEEGTWTPVIGGSGGTSGQSYTTQVGSYVKIGRMVFIQFNIILSAKGTITTNVQIQGLPFTAENTAGQTATCVLYFNTLNSTWVNLIATIVPNTTTANVTGAAIAAITNTTALSSAADILNTTQLAGSFSYRASA